MSWILLESVRRRDEIYDGSYFRSTYSQMEVLPRNRNLTKKYFLNLVARAGREGYIELFKKLYQLSRNAWKGKSIYEVIDASLLNTECNQGFFHYLLEYLITLDSVFRKKGESRKFTEDELVDICLHSYFNRIGILGKSYNSLKRQREGINRFEVTSQFILSHRR